jgi:chromosome segregation ATPase
MDATPQHTENELKLIHLQAECESLKGQLEEYLYIISVRDNEIESLQQRLAEKNQRQSNIDNQQDELQLLQNDIHHLKLRISGDIGLERQIDTAVNAEHELEESKEQITYLQTQIITLQEQLNELSNRNLMLQQETSKAAELESSLEDALRERDELKEKLENGGQI